MGRPLLSVVCLTHHPGHQVAAALGPLRDLAEEIIVAADARVAVEELGLYAAVADQLHRIEVGYFERAIGWLLARCTGDWILRIDGDEVVSGALLDALPELLADRGVMQYWLPRRWLYGDRDTWLAGLPWWPDHNNRLVRAGAGAQHPGIMHAPITPVGPARHVDAPLYHLTLLTDPPSARAARALLHERIRPGLRAPGGGPVNAMFYLPEAGEPHLTAPVPDADRPLIAAAFERRRQPAPADVPPVVTAAERDAAIAGAPMSEADHAARLAVMEREHRAVAGQGHVVHAIVTNLGGVAWPTAGGAGPEIRLVHRWLRAGEPIDADEPRHAFPTQVPAGGERIAPLELTAPAEPGDYELELRLVHEHVRWFDVELRLATRVVAAPARGPAPTRRRWRPAAPSPIPDVVHLAPDVSPLAAARWAAVARGWEIRRWDADQIADVIDPGEHPAAARFAVLLAEGGVWAAADAVPRPPAPLVDGVDGFAFTDADAPGAVSADLLGARPGHPVMRWAREISRGLGVVDGDPRAGAGLALGMAIAAAPGFAVYGL